MTVNETGEIPCDMDLRPSGASFRDSSYFFLPSLLPILHRTSPLTSPIPPRFNSIDRHPAATAKKRPPRALALAALAAALALSACSRRPEPAESAPSPYPYAAGIAHVFVATGGGLVPLAFGASAEALTGPPAPASRAHNASILGADLSRIVAAVNGYGVAIVLPSPDGRAFNIGNLGAPFGGLTTGGIWPFDGGFLVQLYRDPFSEYPPVPGGSASVEGASLYRVGPEGAISELPLGGPQGYDLFALFPTESKSWVAAFRKEAAGQAVTRFMRLGPPGASAEGGREISRAEFEAAIAPEPLSAAPGASGEALRRACATLAGAAPGSGTGPGASAPERGAAPGAAAVPPVLARLRDARGLDRWYGVASAETREISAWAMADGRVLALDRSGELAAAGSAGEVGRLRIAAPVEGAVFVALASAGGLVAAAWEAGSFPEISAAGLVVLAAPR
jgi:hypothetical protein